MPHCCMQVSEVTKKAPSLVSSRSYACDAIALSQGSFAAGPVRCRRNTSAACAVGTNISTLHTPVTTWVTSLAVKTLPVSGWRKGTNLLLLPAWSHCISYKTTHGMANLSADSTTTLISTDALCCQVLCTPKNSLQQATNRQQQVKSCCAIVASVTLASTSVHRTWVACR